MAAAPHGPGTVRDIVHGIAGEVACTIVKFGICVCVCVCVCLFVCVCVCV